MKKIIFITIMMFTFNVYSTECNTNDVLIASCNLSGKTKRVAIFCADEKTDTVYYTFKKGNTPELTVNFSEKRKLKRWVDQGTYTTYFGFTRGEYSYVMGVPEERPGATAFLDIKKGGETISSKECDSNSFGEKDVKNSSIEDVLDSSVRNNSFKFP